MFPRYLNVSLRHLVKYWIRHENLTTSRKAFQVPYKLKPASLWCLRRDKTKQTKHQTTTTTPGYKRKKQKSILDSNSKNEAWLPDGSHLLKSSPPGQDFTAHLSQTALCEVFRFKATPIPSFFPVAQQTVRCASQHDASLSHTSQAPVDTKAADPLGYWRRNALHQSVIGYRRTLKHQRQGGFLKKATKQWERDYLLLWKWESVCTWACVPPHHLHKCSKRSHQPPLAGISLLQSEVLPALVSPRPRQKMAALPAAPALGLSMIGLQITPSSHHPLWGSSSHTLLFSWSLPGQTTAISINFRIHIFGAHYLCEEPSDFSSSFSFMDAHSEH